jgi:5-oxoprolinase (ATP-hydrolysing)
VLIRNFKLFDAGRPTWPDLRTLLSSGTYPSRAVETNLADINAQVAANRLGQRELLNLAQRFGVETVIAFAR